MWLCISGLSFRHNIQFIR
ncbi:unnamed protein product [Spirodela intermedia]|uniref:Uncharacterized protein n=1 Tax=Spirodela intermedia TaxID=51605 RepID=A0ABN7E7V3_SPIIN|nr:unnamed protein product [Spirodela intermedia]